MRSNVTVGNSLLNLLTDFFVVVAVNQVMLCHCWFIVCLIIPGSFPRAIHKGFKTCPVQKAAARKEETLGSMSVKSAVNAGKVN